MSTSRTGLSISIPEQQSFHRGLVIPYDSKKAELTPFMGLTNWSETFPFVVDGVEYPSVDHYVFSIMTLGKYRPQLLSIRHNNILLRETFNELSHKMFLDVSRTTVQKAVMMQYLLNKNVRQYVQQNANHYYYYITKNNVTWGINEDGYGYNLIGQAYSRLVSKDHSSYYRLTESSIYMIYKASVLCTHHVKVGNDVVEYVGESVENILRFLLPFYQDQVVFLPSNVVMDMYTKDPMFEFIQMEIDYPMNLAGFIRQYYVHEINYYLRQRFHRLIMSKYFGHILKKKFTDHIDATQLDYYVQQQLSKLKDHEFQLFANKLYALYKRPNMDAGALSSFLTRSDRDELFDIESQFLSMKEIKKYEQFVPFLYMTKISQSMYIYNEREETSTSIQPSTTYLSPYAGHEFDVYHSLANYNYVHMTATLTNTSIEHATELFNGISWTFAQQEYQEMFVKEVGRMKMATMVRGMKYKFGQSIFARYLLYDTEYYNFNVHIQDPDAMFQSSITEELLRIRNLLVSPIYGITYSLVQQMDMHTIYLQDRVRYRLEDFLVVFRAYLVLKGLDKITLPMYEKLQRLVFHDPKPMMERRGATFRTVHPKFITYFDRTCDMSTISALWKFFVHYMDILRSNVDMLQKDTQPSSVHTESSIPSTVSYFIRTFYEKGREMEFYLFLLRMLLGKTDVSFEPSITYYNLTLENEYRQFLPLNEYDTMFLVNVMGVTAILQKNMPQTRQVYFSYLGLPIQTPPYESNLARRMNAHIYVLTDIDVPEMGRKKKPRKKKTIEQIREITTAPTSVEEGQQQQQQEEYDLEEMLQDLGLESEEEEDEEEQDMTDENE